MLYCTLVRRNIDPALMIDMELKFEPLPMRKRHMRPISGNQYRIIGEDGSPKHVEATTAYEAFKLSGLGMASKIERLVNIKSIIVSKSVFTDDSAPDVSDSLDSAMKAEAEQMEQMKMLRNPVISAHDLDSIMQRFHKEELAIPQPESFDAKGTEIHGDGFDEIIPASSTGAVAAKQNAGAAPAKEVGEKIQPSDIPDVMDAPVTPEKSLSPEEIEKLLKGK